MLNFFRRKASIELPSITLADEAVSTVGANELRRAQSLKALRDKESRLDRNIRRELDALAVVRSAISREEAADAVAAMATVESDIAAAVEGIELDLDAALDLAIADKRSKQRKPVLAAVVRA